MSRTPPPPSPPPPVTGRLAVPRPATEWTDEECAERLTYSTLPEIAGVDGAVAFAKNVLRVEISTHYVRRAVGTHRWRATSSATKSVSPQGICTT